MASFYPRGEFFWNLDLDVHASVSSDAEFAVLIDGLAPVAYHLERPPGLATFELHERPADPGAAILAFVRQIESLDPTARAFWDVADSTCAAGRWMPGKAPLALRAQKARARFQRVVAGE